MATFSLYENVIIKDAKTAEAFVKAIEESEIKGSAVRGEYKKVSPEESRKLHELRKKRRQYK